jgi:phage gp36-like protein
VAYCTTDDLKKALPEEKLIELTGGGESIDTDVTDFAILAADRTVDAYVGAVRTVPLTSVPGLIRDLAVDLAVAWLFGRSLADVPEEWQGRRQAAVATLRDIRDGQVRLDGVTAENSARLLSVESRNRIFSATKLAKMP